MAVSEALTRVATVVALPYSGGVGWFSMAPAPAPVSIVNGRLFVTRGPEFG